MLPRPPRSPLFPYTTLFRSVLSSPLITLTLGKRPLPLATTDLTWDADLRPIGVTLVTRRESGRSEEHTSELQSHVNLVCRLLLEKKKRMTNQPCFSQNDSKT